MKNKTQLTFITTILIISLVFGFSNFQLPNVKADDYYIEETFTENVETYFEEISITSSPAVLHLRFDYLSSNVPNMVMQVYNITAGNNTQMWSDSEMYYTMRFESNIDLNITVTSTDDTEVYPAPFRLTIHVNPIPYIVDQEEYTWEESLYYSGDYNYLIFTYNEITSVNIHSVLNETDEDDTDFWVKARYFGTSSWLYEDYSTEEETFLSFQVMPGETWEIYVETVGDPTIYPLNFTMNIDISDKTSVNSNPAEFSSFLTEEDSSHFYEITITEAPIKMRVFYESNYTLNLYIFNTTHEIFNEWDPGWDYTFTENGDYLLKVSWNTPIASTKNNYTLKLQIGALEVDLVLDELIILEDNFFSTSDNIQYDINIPAGHYQFKILELGSRHDWVLNFTQGYSDGWANFYYTVTWIPPVIFLKTHNFKDPVYSKLVDQSCSLTFNLSQHSTQLDFKVGLLIQEYILPDDYEEDTLTGEFLNEADFDMYRVNVTETKFLEISLDTSYPNSIDNVSIQIYNDELESIYLWALNDSYIIEFEPPAPGIYYIVIKSDGSLGEYYLIVKVQDVTKKGSGFDFAISIISLLTIEIVCIVYSRRRKK